MVGGEDFGLSCACGSQHFERVVVRRTQQADYVTEFVTCIHCKVMFFVPHAATLLHAGSQAIPPCGAGTARDTEWVKPTRTPIAMTETTLQSKEERQARSRRRIQDPPQRGLGDGDHRRHLRQ